VVAFDTIVTEENCALFVWDPLPLKMGTDVPSSSAEDVYSSVVGVVFIAHDDVGREASLPLRPPQNFLDGLGAPPGGEVACNNVALGIEDSYLVCPLPLSTLPQLRWNALVGRELLVHMPYPRELNFIALGDVLH